VPRIEVAVEADIRPPLTDLGDFAPLEIGGASGSGGDGVVQAVPAASPVILKPAGVVPLFIPEFEGEQVGAVVKTRPRPSLPTPDEITAHEATHHPYRNWCRHCVAGAGRRDGHATISVASRDEGIVTVSSDYCYFNDEQLVGAPAGKHTPI
jgi:hypothetical protein